MKMEELPKKRSSSRSKKRWSGAIEGIHKGLLYGWAVDTEKPQARVVLEICLNGEPVGTVTADVSRTDLMEKFAGDACHGFVAELGEVDSDGILTARVANTECFLDNHLPWNSDKKPSASATSTVFSDGGLQLQGWAIDPANEKKHVQVFAYVGEKRVAAAVANIEHPALRPYNVGGHGFTLSLPLDLADGQLHIVRVVDHNGVPLNGSPLTACVSATGLQSLLPSDSPDVIAHVVKSYEQYLPRSVGVQHYRAWSALFNRPEDTNPTSKLNVALIITAGSDEAIATTTASIAAQTHRGFKIFKPAAGKEFAEQLRAALAGKFDVITAVRAGDVLFPHALAAALEGFNLPGSEIVYSDSEFNDVPWLKPAWNPDYAYGSDYLLELLLVRGTILDKRDLPQSPADFAWSAIARAAKQNPNSIVHVPKVLYRFETRPSPLERESRMQACAAALSVVEPGSKLVRLPQPSTPLFDMRRVVRPLSKKERTTQVSIIIPTRDGVELLQRCIESLYEFTEWPNLEIIVIDNGSVESKTKAYFRALAKKGVRVLPMPGPFNFADLNNRAVEAAEGNIIVLMNNDIEALHEGWLDEIVSQLLRPGVGAVGAKLLWPNGMVQHGGVVMGVGNAAAHFGNQLANSDLGDHGRNQLVQQMSGVTAACLAIRKSHFIGAGAMDSVAFPVAFNDVDFCLRLRQLGKLITWTPFAQLLHAESASRGAEDTSQKRARAKRELEQLRLRWGQVLMRDPAYSPAFSLDPHTPPCVALSLPPRELAPRTSALWTNT